MSPTMKPAIVIIPGSWHIPKHYLNLESGLKAAGYKVTTCSLPSTGPPKAHPDAAEDVAGVQAAMQAYIDRGLNIVLVMHSIGGVVGGRAAEGFRPEDQPSGKGIVALVYIAGFALPEGKSIMDLRPQPEHLPWVVLDGEMGSPTTFMRCDALGWGPEKVFYNDCTPEDQAAATADIIYNASESLCFDRGSVAPYTDIESNYLITELDVAIPPFVQELMSSSEGGKWKRVERLESGHAPFLSRPEETVAFVRRCAGEEL